jgi:hypothetical protein
MAQTPRPVESLPYHSPDHEMWMPVVKVVVAAGAIVGALRVVLFTFQLYMTGGAMWGQLGNHWANVPGLLVELAGAGAGLALILSIPGCLRRRSGARRAFVVACAAMLLATGMGAAIVVVNTLGQSGFFIGSTAPSTVAWSSHTILIFANDCIAPGLLLWLTSRTPLRSTFGD